MLSSGTRLWPPARTLPSGPTSASTASASSTVAGRWYSKAGGFMAASSRKRAPEGGSPAPLRNGYRSPESVGGTGGGGHEGNRAASRCAPGSGAAGRSGGRRLRRRRRGGDPGAGRLGTAAGGARHRGRADRRD